MAALRFLLRQSRRFGVFESPSPPHSLLLLRRFSSEFTSSVDPTINSEPINKERMPLPLQPVSYNPKPKPPPSEEDVPKSPAETHATSPDGQEPRAWTRSEMRYIKDAPVIAPVSYATRVAPLPEYQGEMGEREKESGNEQRQRERRMIELQRRRSSLRYVKEVEEDNLPFPKLLKPDTANQDTKKKEKVIYDLKEAIRLVKANARKTFDETLEVHVKMSPELRRTDLKLNGFVRLPHGFGKTYRVAVFAEGAAADEAREAGADIVGGPELVEEIKNGNVKVDFDKCISTQSMMEHVKKLSRNLKQLMPDKKKGTLTNDMSRAVKEAKEQSVLFKKDKTAIVHVGLGKLSFIDDALNENIGAFVNALLVCKASWPEKEFQVCWLCRFVPHLQHDGKILPNFNTIFVHGC